MKTFKVKVFERIHLDIEIKAGNYLEARKLITDEYLKNDELDNINRKTFFDIVKIEEC